MDTFIARKMLLGGLCGGLAEVLWVMLYASVTSVSGTEVARQVAVTVFPGAADLAAAPVLGIAVHLVLSLALGAIFAWAVWIPFARRLDFPAAMMTAIAALLAVWAVNFFVIAGAEPAFRHADAIRRELDLQGPVRDRDGLGAGIRP